MSDSTLSRGWKLNRELSPEPPEISIANLEWSGVADPDQDLKLFAELYNDTSALLRSRLETSNSIKMARYNEASKKFSEAMFNLGTSFLSISKKSDLLAISGDVGRANQLYDMELTQIASDYFAELTTDTETNDGRSKLILNFPSTGGERQQKLYVELKRTLNVIDLLYAKPSRSTKNNTYSNLSVYTYNGYVRELYDIARHCLLNDDTSSRGESRLAAFKEMALEREAGRAKNRYIYRLGCRASIYFILFSSLATVLRLDVLNIFSNLLTKPIDYDDIKLASNLLLVMAASAAGTWLSFSIRKIELTFHELVSPEKDLLNPTARIIYVSILSLLFSLLIQANFMSIAVNNVKITFSSGAIIPLIFGALCGLSERSLSRAISNKSASILGTKPPTQEG